MAYDSIEGTKTPYCDTGLISQASSFKGQSCDISPPEQITVRLDWLQVVTHHPGCEQDFARLIEFLEFWFQDKIDYSLDKPIYRGRRWDGSGVSIRGIQIAHRVADDGSFYGWVQIPGSCWPSMDLPSTRVFCRELASKWSAECKRIDIALDDYARQLDFAQISDAIESGHYAWAKKARYFCEYTSDGFFGQSWVFGSDKSDKRLTIYDKNAESRGKQNCIRSEARFRDFKANECFQFIAATKPEDCQFLPNRLAEFVVGCIDFVIRSDKNLDRSIRLPWWQHYLDRVGEGVRFPAKKRELSLNKTVTWMYYQVCCAFAVLREIMGYIEFGVWASHFADTGKGRFEKRHFDMITIFKREWAGTNTYRWQI